MKQRLSLLLFLVGCMIIPGIFVKSATAQVTPDGTTNTTVNAQGNNITIQDGNREGSNLFHSFQDFSVPNGGEAFFDNAADIANILSRVTGGNISNIDGLIRANGSANLFLINPAGIIFGSGASLNIGGSFYGSSASSILFENGEFSATDPQNPPLLRVNAPIGLGFREEPGDIVNQSGASLQVAIGETIALLGGNINLDGGMIFTPAGRAELGGLSTAGEISINADDSFSFPDGIERANVTLTNGGRVSASTFAGTPNSVENSGEINITTNNLSLTQGSVVDASILGEGNAEGDGGAITIDASGTISVEGAESGIFSQVGADVIGNAGGIDITTANLELTQGGVVTANTGGQGDGGSITIDAIDTISVEGAESGIFSQVLGGAAGTSGGIDITTSNLSLTEGGVLTDSTFGSGDGGAITIEAIDTISVVGAESGIFSQVLGGVEGNAGGIDITTGNLSLTQGGVVTANTFGLGNGGAITIDAIDTISVVGETPDGTQNSGIFSQVGADTEGNVGQGNAGEIDITTANLELTEGGVVTNTTFGSGDGGAITIEAIDTISVVGAESGIFSQVGADAVGNIGQGNAGGIDITTANLELTERGVVNNSTSGQGNAGTITIEASDTISVDGENQSGFITGIFSQVLEDGEGSAGEINITTNNLSLTNDARISVQSLEQGNAGDLEIIANSLDLENGASLLASTPMGTGGNITLQIDDTITLSNNSTISAQAFNQANGGNLTIDTNFIVAFPSRTPENGNDIIANAQGGDGGNINITAESLLGIQERTARDGNGTNDIDASSEFGLDGNINISTPDLNTIKTDLEPPNNPLESEQTVAQACKSDYASRTGKANRLAAQVSSLTIQGRGGIPPQPIEPIDSDIILLNGKTTTPQPQVQSPDIPPLGTNMGKTTTAKPKVQSLDIKPIKTSIGDIFPAKGVIKTEDGQIMLTAYPTDKIPTRTPDVSPKCS